MNNATLLQPVRIAFLMEYRAAMLRQDMLPESGYLEIEMDRSEWAETVWQHQTLLSIPVATFSAELCRDKEGPMRGREFSTYNGIKCYFRT